MERFGMKTHHRLLICDGQSELTIPFKNTILVAGQEEQAKLCWGFADAKKWSKIVISSSDAVIDRLSLGLNPEDIVKDIQNLLVIDNFVSFDVSFDTTEANFTWRKVAVKNDAGVYVLIGTIPPPGFTKTNSQTVQYFSQIEYEA